MIDTGPKKNSNESNKSGYTAGDEISSEDDTCSICKRKVYLMERHRKNNLLYHRKCYRDNEQLGIQKFCNESNDLFKNTPGYKSTSSLLKLKSSEDKENARSFLQNKLNLASRYDTSSSRNTSQPSSSISEMSISASTASSNTLTPTVVQNSRPITHFKVFQPPTNHLTSISDSILEITKAQDNFSTYNIIRGELVRSDMEEDICIVSSPSKFVPSSTICSTPSHQERNTTNSAITDNKTFNMLRSLRSRNKTKNDTKNPFDVSETKLVCSSMGHNSPSLTSVSSLDLKKSSKENLSSKQVITTVTASLTSVSDISTSPVPKHDVESKKVLGPSMMNAVMWLNGYNSGVRGTTEKRGVCQSCGQNLCSSKCYSKNRTKMSSSIDSLEHTTCVAKNQKSEEYTNIVLLPQLKVSDEFDAINDLYETDRTKIEAGSVKKVVAVDIIMPGKKVPEAKKDYNLTDHLTRASVRPRVERNCPKTYCFDEGIKDVTPVTNVGSNDINKFMKTIDDGFGDSPQKYLEFSKRLNNDINELEDEIKRRKKLSQSIREKLTNNSVEKSEKTCLSRNNDTNNRRSNKVNESLKSKHFNNKVKNNIKLFSSGAVQKLSSKSSAYNLTKTDPVPVPRQSMSKNVESAAEPVVKLVDIMHQVPSWKTPLKKETENKSFSLLLNQKSNDSVKIFGDSKTKTQMSPTKLTEKVGDFRPPLEEDPKSEKTEISKIDESVKNENVSKDIEKTEPENEGPKAHSQTTTKVKNSWDFQFKLLDNERGKIDLSQKKLDSKAVEFEETKDTTGKVSEEKATFKIFPDRKIDTNKEVDNETKPPRAKDVGPEGDKTKPAENIEYSAKKDVTTLTDPEEKSETLSETKLVTCKSTTTQTSEVFLPSVIAVPSAIKCPPRPPPPNLHTGNKSNQTSFDSIYEQKLRKDIKQEFSRLKSLEKVELKPKKSFEKSENKETVIAQNLISSDTVCATLKKKKKVSSGSHSSFFEKLSMPKFHRKVVKPKSVFYKSFDTDSPNFEEEVISTNNKRISNFKSQKKVLEKLRNDFHISDRESPEEQNEQNVSLKLKGEVKMTHLLDKQLKDVLSNDSQKLLLDQNMDTVNALIIQAHQDQPHPTNKHEEKVTDELTLHHVKQNIKAIELDNVFSRKKPSQPLMENTTSIHPSLTFFDIQNLTQDSPKTPSENLKPPRPAAIPSELLSIKSDRTIAEGRKKVTPSNDPSLKSLNSTDSESPEDYAVPDFISDPYLYEVRTRLS